MAPRRAGWCLRAAEPWQWAMCAQGITKELRGAPGQAPPGSGQVVEALGRARLVLRIFFSLNSPGLTEVRARSTCASSGMCMQHACLIKNIIAIDRMSPS